MLTFQCAIPSNVTNPLTEDYDIVEVVSHDPCVEDIIMHSDGSWNYREDVEVLESDDQVIFFESPVYDHYNVAFIG